MPRFGLRWLKRLIGARRQRRYSREGRGGQPTPTIQALDVNSTFARDQPSPFTIMEVPTADVWLQGGEKSTSTERIQPRTECTDKQQIDEREPCPICHDDVGVVNEEGALETWSTLRCGHKFGSKCIQSWVQDSLDRQDPSKPSGPTCPICRAVACHPECGHAVYSTPLTAPEGMTIAQYIDYIIYCHSQYISRTSGGARDHRRRRRLARRGEATQSGLWLQGPDYMTPNFAPVRVVAHSIGECLTCAEARNLQQLMTQRMQAFRRQADLEDPHAAREDHERDDSTTSNGDNEARSVEIERIMPAATAPAEAAEAPITARFLNTYVPILKRIGEVGAGLVLPNRTSNGGGRNDSSFRREASLVHRDAVGERESPQSMALSVFMERRGRRCERSSGARLGRWPRSWTPGPGRQVIGEVV